MMTKEPTEQEIKELLAITQSVVTELVPVVATFVEAVRKDIAGHDNSVDIERCAARLCSLVIHSEKQGWLDK